PIPHTSIYTSIIIITQNHSTTLGKKKPLQIYKKNPMAMGDQEATMSEQQMKSNNDGNNNIKRRRRTKLNAYDKIAVGSVLGAHLLAMYAPFCFSWDTALLGFSLYVVTGLFGICFSYHRNLAHQSFKVPKWLEYLCAYCGAHALQGDPMTWVSNHRFHHQYTDTERDPHSPIEGFWHSHLSWIFDSAAIREKCGKRTNIEDLKNQAFYRWLRRTYFFHPMALVALLYTLGGFPYIVWGMGVRLVITYHCTWLVNSAAHIWGNRAWNTNDLSRNNWWVAIVAFGEGWHNNHHAFQYSARQGLEWWQIDMTWYVILLLEGLGFAYDIKLPNETQMQKLAIKT
ncbi:Palmitoyl-monogalactosyldiacylglycerol delta-7 desaturase, chloroplastic, partial [Linum perenne]